MVRMYKMATHEAGREHASNPQDDKDKIQRSQGLAAQDGRLIEESFQNLRTKAGLPRVVFHSLRHSSTTYKLKLNHGDLKATQGDTGHAEIDRITKVYAHILDEDRKINAQKFETAFYSNPDLRAVKPPESPESVLELDHLIEQLRRSPGLKKTVSQLVAASDFS